MRTPIIALTPDIPDEQLLTVADLASIFTCERTKARKLVDSGIILGAVRVGSQYRIAAGKVRAWLASEALPRNPQIFALRQRLRRHAS